MGEAGIILNVDILSTLQEDPDVLEEWAHKNLVKLSKDKCKVLHLGKHNPGVQHRLGLTQLGSSSGEGALEVLVDTKLVGVTSVLRVTRCVAETQWEAGLHQQGHHRQMEKSLSHSTLHLSGHTWNNVHSFVPCYSKRSGWTGED